MNAMQLTITPLVLLSFAVLCSPTSGAEPPKVLYLGTNRTLQRPKPPKMAPVFVKKNTWHETMRASLEATFGSTIEKDRAGDDG